VRSSGSVSADAGRTTCTCTVPILIAHGVSCCFVAGAQDGVCVGSAVVPERGAGVRLVAAGHARRVRHGRGVVGAASRGGGAASSGRSTAPVVAGAGGVVRAGPGAAARTVEASDRHSGHTVGLASPTGPPTLDLREPARTTADQRRRP
jgi:hypothetical protein